MKPRLFSGIAGIAAIALALVFATAARHSPSFEERESSRLRLHFDSVLVELESRDVSALTAAQRAARSTHIARLREYRDAGEYPRNLVSREATPVFVDPFGTHCAMGYLIARAGRSDIVARIASTRNLARIPDLADDAALISWLDAAGLSVEEAARIQPAYDWREPGDNELAARRWTTSTRGYQVSTLVHAGVSSALTAGNLLRPGHSGLSLAGALVGSAGIGLAASHLSNPDAPRSYAAANGIMAAATIASAWRSARHATLAQSRPVPAGQSASTYQMSPLVSPTAVGVSLSFR